MRRSLVILSGFVVTLMLLFASAASALNCSPPTTNTVKICTPQNNTTINGAVELSVAANVGGLTLMRVHDNDQPVYESPMSSFDTFLYFGSGLHHIRVVSGTAVRRPNHRRHDRLLLSDGEPHRRFARDNLRAGALGLLRDQHIRLYMDNKDVFDANYSTSIFTQLPLSPGSHTMVASRGIIRGNSSRTRPRSRERAHRAFLTARYRSAGRKTTTQFLHRYR